MSEVSGQGGYVRGQRLGGYIRGQGGYVRGQRGYVRGKKTLRLRERSENIEVK